MLMPESNYYASIIGCSCGASPSKGTPFVKIEMEVTHAAERSDWVELPKPEKRGLFIYCSDASWDHAKAKLEKLGFNGCFDERAAVTATQAEVTCEHEDYNGKTTEKWELTNWGGAREAKPLDKPSAMRLAQLYKSATNGAAKPAGKPPAPKASAPPAEAQHVPTGSEIPF